MLNFLRLVRWKNLLLIAFVQLLIKYALLEPFGVAITLNGFGFSILVVATLCLAAAGNIINDIFDQDTDSINKPNRLLIGKFISEKSAYSLFIAFNVIGVLLGFYLAHLVGKPGFFAVFVCVSALLYIYASYLKQLPVVGNLVISVLVALSLLIVGLFELLPAITAYNQQTQLTYFKIIADYALFAFFINLIRELVKDLEDIPGDYKSGMRTLPIILGRTRATNIALALSTILLAAVVHYLITYMYENLWLVVYFLMAVVAPLLYIVLRLFYAKLVTDYKQISTILKLIMLTGMSSMLIYKFILLP
ncbi:geranylgeranylglycerol-phosphate geranylgeranyltransferase [Bizionia sediminis]|uniref:Geranylgeranylglycerol-phosphate geranylgeranyltransferase n=1 Tax=Bizionia sediminis TaxID=1737064 RepID=A0ABW5KQR0_9FLAO